MAELYPRYSPTSAPSSEINKPGNVSAFKIDPKTGQPVGDIGLGGTKPTVTTPAVNPPTTSETALEKAQREYFEGLNKKMPDKTSAYEQALKQMQGVIDSIELQYKSITDEQTRVGNLALDRNRAIQSKGGLVGSTFGEAQTGQITAQNLRAQKLIQAEKQARIAEVFSQARSNADEKIKAEREEALGNQRAYLDYLAGAQDKARTNVKTLAAGGVSLTELSADQYQQLLKDSGLDEFTFKAFYNSNKPAEAQTKYQYEVQGSKIIAYGVDPSTGKLEMTSTDLPAGAAGGGKYKEQVMPDGTLLLIPENFDPAKPIEGQIIKAGKYKNPTAEKKEGWSSASNTEKSSVLAWLQAQPDYTADDLEKIKSDPQFFLQVLGQANLDN